MVDLDSLERQANSWVNDDKDPANFSKGTELLKFVNEQRKLVAERDKLLSEKAKLDVDATNGRRFWTTKVASLAPMFAAIITGLTFFLTFLGQQRQSNVAAEQGEAKEWREALQKISTADPASTQAGAFGLHSFFDSKHYWKPSRQLAAVLLANVRDDGAFDFLCGELGKRAATIQEQSDLLDVARAISARLRESYKSLPADAQQKLTFEEFLIDPHQVETADATINKDKLQVKLNEADGDVGKLDTLSNILSHLWLPAPSKVDPAQADLRGVILVSFISRDFRTPGLKNALMDSTTAFYGNCVADDQLKARRADGVIVNCP